MVKKQKSQRVASGISIFDSIIQGGFIPGSINLVAGGPGTGKTIFCLQFLYNGATKFKENGLFVTFILFILSIL